MSKEKQHSCGKDYLKFVSTLSIASIYIRDSRIMVNNSYFVSGCSLGRMSIPHTYLLCQLI